jgi:hypothetical protein
VVRVFLLRELRRDAPLAIAALSLGLLCLVSGAVLQNFVPSVESGAAAFAGFVVVLLAAPLLLGVATVAPDTESGAVAFLARMPHSRRLELAVRWGVAAALTAATVALQVVASVLYAATAPRESEILRLSPPAIVAVAVGAFAAGAAASAAFRRSMSALVAAPLIFGAPALLLIRLGNELGPTMLGVELASVLIPVAIAAGIAAFLRGQIHRPSLRPLKIVAGTTAAATLTLAGGAYGWDVGAARWKWTGHALRDRSATKHVFCESLEKGFGISGGQRWVLVDGSAHDHVLPEGWPIGFSPDGARVLVQQGLRKCVLVDASTGQSEKWTARATPGPARRSLGVQGEGIAWRRGHPVVARISGQILEDTKWSAPGGRVESCAGSRLLLVDDAGARRIWDLEREAALPSPLDALPPETRLVEATLTSDGASILARGDLAGAGYIFVLSVEKGPIARLALAEEEAQLGVNVWSSPERLAISTHGITGTKLITMLDLRTGEMRTEMSRDYGFQDATPSGRLLLRIGSGELVDATDGKRLDDPFGPLASLHAAGFYDETHCFRVSEDATALEIVGVEGGPIHLLR